MEPTPLPNNKSVIQLISGPLWREVQTAFGKLGQADYLLASNARRQVWHFWLHAFASTLAPDVLPHLVSSKSKALVAEALEEMGIQCPCSGLIGALGKLGQFALPRETYQNLCEILLERGRGTKFITHQNVLTAEMIDRLHMLPDPLRRPEIVLAVDDGLEDLPQISFLLKQRPDLMRFVERANIGDAQSIVATLLEQIRSYPDDVELPLVWQGNATIRPIQSTSELKRLATEMDNCLVQYCNDLLMGSKALFVLVGEVPVAICFTRLLGVGWELEQIRGPKNRLPTRSEYQRIRQAFSSQSQFFIPRENLVRKALLQAHYAPDEGL